MKCKKVATDGAHVVLADDPNGPESVVPMCHEHNMQHGALFELKDGTLSANTADTGCYVYQR
jgi:hypothetical protein